MLSVLVRVLCYLSIYYYIYRIVSDSLSSGGGIPIVLNLSSFFFWRCPLLSAGAANPAGVVKLDEER